MPFEQGLSRAWYSRGARAAKSRKYSDMYDAWADYRSKYIAPGLALGTKTTYQESFFQGYLDHSARQNPGVTVRKKKGVGWYLVEAGQMLGVKMTNGDIVAYYATKKLAQSAADRANQPPVWMPGQRSRRRNSRRRRRVARRRY